MKSNEETLEIDRLCQSYIIEQLKKFGQKSLANSLSNHVQPPSDITHKIIQKISNQLAEEQTEKLEDICFELQLSKDTLSDTFDTISSEMFRNGIKWGRIVTYIAFSGALAVYCAEHYLADQVIVVMNNTTSFIHKNLLEWITASGGWPAFIKHFSEQEAFLPAFVIGMGITALSLAGGLFILKKKFSTPR